MLSLTISHYWTLIMSFRSTNISPLRYEATDKVSLCRKQAYHLLLYIFSVVVFSLFSIRYYIGNFKIIINEDPFFITP